MGNEYDGYEIEKVNKNKEINKNKDINKTEEINKNKEINNGNNLNEKEDLETENLALKKEIEELKEKNNKIEEIIEDYKSSEYGKYIDLYLKEQNLNKKLENKIKIIDAKDSESKSTILLNEYNEQIYNLKQDNLNLNKQFQDYKKNDYNEEFIEKEMEDFYDVIINIKSISSLAKEEGWSIKMNKNIKDINNIELKNIFKIGILGNGNVGKSFLLSRLFNEKIPVGYSVVTEGISIKFKENKYVILDSAGLQTPLIRNTYNESTNKGIDEEDKDNKEYQNLYKDKAQTENFIQSLILYLSDMFVIVVGKLTFNEQKLINRIKHDMEAMKDEEHKKQIFVIHNLLNFQTKKQVEDYIKNTLLNVVSFNLKEQNDFMKKEENQNNFYYVEEKKYQTYHLIMAKEATEAGDYYNNSTYKFLTDKFSNFTKRKDLHIIKEVKDRFIEWSSDLLEDKIEPDNIEIIEENQFPKKYVFKPTEKKEKLVPKACFSDELGFIFYRTNEYEPSFNYYIEDDKFLAVKLEIPGNVEFEDAFASVDSKEIFISGKKICDDDSNKILKNTRLFGKFNLQIPYPSQITISNEEPITEETKEKEANSKNGIYIFKFELAKRRRKKTVNN